MAFAKAMNNRITKKEDSEKKKEKPPFDPDNCYQNARKSCKHGCIVDHNNKYIIPNNIWALNQRKLMKTRESDDDFEKDKVMREALYHKLVDKQIETVKDHVRLKFTLLFDSDDYILSKKENYTLCESCYVIFNNHRCKLFLFLFECH